MKDYALTAQALPNTEVEPATPSAQPVFLTARAQIALLATFLVIAGQQAVAAGIDLSPITTLVCDVATQLTATTLLGAAGFVIVVVFGWNKIMGEANAFQGLKNGVIGGIIILGAGTVAQALFKGTC